MKKLLRIAVVLGLVMCLSVSAFAAGASTQGVTVDGKAVTADGQELDVTVTTTDVTLTTTDAATVVDAAGASVEAADLTIAWLQDVKVEIPAGGSVTITFDVPSAAADQTVYVLHYNGTTWEKVGEGKGNKVTATFTSLSPVAIVLEKVAAPAPGPSSPVTGEEPALLVVAAVVALLAGTVAVVTLKKKEN